MAYEKHGIFSISIGAGFVLSTVGNVLYRGHNAVPEKNSNTSVKDSVVCFFVRVLFQSSLSTGTVGIYTVAEER